MNRISEKHKLYFLIVMACIAGLIGYFRFFHTSATTEKAKPASQQSDTAAAALSSHREPSKSDGGPTQREPRMGRPIGRNIFEPAGPLPVTPGTTPTAGQTAPAELSLSGTIIGGNLSMAIINNRFMRQGQMLGKYKITRITPDKVYLSAGDDRQCLSVLTVSEAITQ